MTNYFNPKYRIYIWRINNGTKLIEITVLHKLPIVWKGTHAVLIAVTPFPIDYLKKALPQFIEYDTKFRAKEGHYDLNFKDGLILTFIHINTGIPFTTIRRSYKEKFEYYISSIGETFILEELEK